MRCGARGDVVLDLDASQLRNGRGRPRALPKQVVERVEAAHAGGRSLGEIARELNADNVPTAQGGRQWWPSTVRAVLNRVERE